MSVVQALIAAFEGSVDVASIALGSLEQEIQ